jgi:transcription initiation factor TFIIIB Brf1 subunit/transcription initiation factor TFIIB
MRTKCPICKGKLGVPDDLVDTNLLICIKCGSLIKEEELQNA